MANFRRVPRMPIYGMAQPSAKVTTPGGLGPLLWWRRGGESSFTDSPPVPQALGSILAYLTDTKRKLRQVVWVNLREEAVLECDGHTHSLRWPGPPMAPDQLEVRPSCLLHTPLYLGGLLGRWPGGSSGGLLPLLFSGSVSGSG